MVTFDQKLEALRRRLQELESAVVASGGVDSSVLVVLAREVLGDRMLAATAVSASLPERDRLSAIDLCRGRGIPHRFVETCEFDDERYRANPDDRCYHCKRHLYQALARLADEQGFRWVVEGTNASDLGGHRPGYQASRENGRVATPLIDAGLTKEEVRRVAASFGLATAAKPASACLSSRIPTGVPLSAELMRRIDAAEELIRGLGAGQVRVRHHGELARIEVDAAGMEAVVAGREAIAKRLGELGWRFVALDLQGYRSGQFIVQGEHEG